MLADLQVGMVVDMSPSHGAWAEACLMFQGQVTTYLGIASCEDHAATIQTHLDNRLIKEFATKGSIHEKSKDRSEKIREHVANLFTARKSADDSEDPDVDMSAASNDEEDEA